MNRDLKSYFKKAYAILENQFNRLMENPDESQKQKPLLDVVEDAKREWEDAHNLFEEATDPLLIEHAIHRLDAAEKKYMYLLSSAGKERIINHDVPSIRA